MAKIYDISTIDLLKDEVVSFNNQNKDPNTNNTFIINQLSKKLIEQYDNRLKEKDEIIKELKETINELKSRLN